MTKRNKLAALRKIRKMVESTHWIKGAYYSCAAPGKPVGKDCYCLVGLINTVAGTRSAGRVPGVWMTLEEPRYGSFTLREEGASDAREIGVAIWTAIKSISPRTRATQIETWNDMDRRTREDVLAVLDYAIATVSAPAS